MLLHWTHTRCNTGEAACDAGFSCGLGGEGVVASIGGHFSMREQNPAARRGPASRGSYGHRNLWTDAVEKKVNLLIDFSLRIRCTNQSGPHKIRNYPRQPDDSLVSSFLIANGEWISEIYG